MDTIRKAEYYYVTIPDKPGEGERLFGALRDAGVNLLAVHAFPSARRSHRLGAAGINVTATSATRTGMGRYGALLWVKARDVKKAAEVLGA